MSAFSNIAVIFTTGTNTRDLRPLDPRYVSSVDSGNLAAHLIALANACREWIDAPTPGRSSCIGIKDAVLLAREALQDLPNDLRTHTIASAQLDHALNALAAALDDDEAVPGDIAGPGWADRALPRPLQDIARRGWRASGR